MKTRNWLILAALMAATAVALGAFGAHALADIVNADRLDTWDTASRYLMNHALAILIVASLSSHLKTSLTWVLALLAGGGIVFATTLYMLVLTGITWLGAIAPIGGVLMISGWVLLAVTLAKQKV